MMHAVANPIDTIKEHPHYVLLAPALVLLVGIFLIPIVALFGTSLQESVPIKRYEPGLTFDSYIRYLTDPWFLGQMYRTFRIAFIATALCVLLGWPLSYMIWRAKGLRKSILLTIVLLPLFTNIVARIYAWLIVLGKDGPVNWAWLKLTPFDEPVLLNFQLGPTIMGVTYVALPYFVLIMFSALEQLDWSLVESARTLGAKKLKSIMEVVVPLSAPGLAGAMAVAITWGTGAFAEPRILGSPKEWTIGVESGKQIMQVNDWPFGAALAFILVASTMVFIVLSFKLISRKKVQAPGAGI